MSRSGYGDEYDIGAPWLYRQAVDRAMAGKRGQAFLRELLAALDALPEKRLITEELERDGEVCAIGSVGKARGTDMSKVDAYDPRQVASLFGIAWSMAAEIAYMNDEEPYRPETPEERFTRIRAWVAAQLIEWDDPQSPEHPDTKS